jgi:2,3-bisphosphoglycerate-dependent phosphoglycerate mutase
MTTTLYLIRHAHAIWTPDKGRALSPTGQAGAAHVAALLGDAPIAAIYASPFKRAIQTITLLAKAHGLSVTTITDLRERKLTQPIADHAAAVAWCWANPTAALPGSESNLIAQRRGVAAIIDPAARHLGEAIAVGTHGNLLALILQHRQPAIDHAFWQRLTMPDSYALTLSDTGEAQITQHRDAANHFVPPVAPEEPKARGRLAGL